MSGSKDHRALCNRCGLPVWYYKPEKGSLVAVRSFPFLEVLSHWSLTQKLTQCLSKTNHKTARFGE